MLTRHANKRAVFIQIEQREQKCLVTTLQAQSNDLPSQRNSASLQVCLRVLEQLLLSGWTFHQTLGPLLARALQDTPHCALDWQSTLSALCQESDAANKTIRALQAAAQSLIVWQEGQPSSSEASNLINATLALLRNKVCICCQED